MSGGQVAQRHAAVVGKPERPTPELSSKILEVNFNPYWYVPKSIIYKDLVPKAQEFARNSQDMLAAYHMEAFDPAGNPVPWQAINWIGPRSLQLQFPPASLGGEFLRLHQDQLPEQGCGVHA